MFAGFLISDRLLVLQQYCFIFIHRDVQCDRDNFPFGSFSALCDGVFGVAFWAAFSFHADFLVWYEVYSGQVMKEKE